MKPFINRYGKLRPIDFITSMCLCSIFVFTGCETEIAPTTGVLVLEASLTNGQGQLLAILQRSSPFGQAESSPESGANIQLFENGQQVVTYHEVEPGCYKSVESPDEPLGFQPSVGADYQMAITTKDGEVFESTTQILPAPIPIDSISLERDLTLEVEDDPDQFEPTYIGIVHFQDDPLRGDYFRILVEINGQLLDAASDWVLVDDRITNNVARQIRLRGAPVKVGDSLAVTLQRLDLGTYKFFEAIQTNTAGLGDPFESPPSPLPTNIFSGNEPAKGYFVVSGKSYAKIKVP